MRLFATWTQARLQCINRILTVASLSDRIASVTATSRSASISTNLTEGLLGFPRTNKRARNLEAILQKLGHL